MWDNKRVNKKLDELFGLFLREGLIKFPSPEQIDAWENVLDKWIEDPSLPLFVRQFDKNEKLRGSEIGHTSNRILIRTDNTPAHWVYKKYVVAGEKPSLKTLKLELKNRTIPLAMVINKKEALILNKPEYDSRNHRMGQDDMKLAHIERVKLPGNKDLPLSEYINHHKRFLSLKNMYLIKQSYAGIAEVKSFNDIVIKHRSQFIIKNGNN